MNTDSDWAHLRRSLDTLQRLRGGWQPNENLLADAVTTLKKKQWQYLDYPFFLPFVFQLHAAKMEELGGLGWEAYAVTRTLLLWHCVHLKRPLHPE